MSTPLNRITRSLRPASIFEDATHLIDSTVSFNQGDLLCLDTTAHLLKIATVEATDSPNFLGIAPVTVVAGKIKRPYTTDVDASQASTAIEGPVYGVIAKMVLNTGSSLNPGQSVYLDPSHGPQSVATTGTSAIGIYQGSQGVISGSAAGLEVEVELTAVYPVTAAVGQT
jgi:hypothetical protein